LVKTPCGRFLTFSDRINVQLAVAVVTQMTGALALDF
jgi:6-phosphogluconolactonase (cycloisomerase 2 family)